jgi:hypothetical protein
MKMMMKINDDDRYYYNISFMKEDVKFMYDIIHPLKTGEVVYVYYVESMSTLFIDQIIPKEC